MTDEEREWLNGLLLVEEGLTAWELGFIEDLDRQEPGKRLTPNQREALRRLWERKSL